MAKKKNGAEGQEGQEGAADGSVGMADDYGFTIKVPEGFEERTGEVVGFWDEKRGPITFIPKGAKAFDSNIDKSKFSLMIFGELVSPIDVDAPGEDGEVITAKPGDLVAIWYKTGMRTLLELAETPVYLYRDGELDMGVGKSAMKVYRVSAKPRTGKPLQLTDDFRKDSRTQKLPLKMNLDRVF